MGIILTEDPNAEAGDVRFRYDDERDRIVKEKFEGHPYHSWMYQNAMSVEGAEIDIQANMND